MALNLRRIPESGFSCRGYSLKQLAFCSGSGFVAASVSLERTIKDDDDKLALVSALLAGNDGRLLMRNW